jgi:hypothetical protein
VADDEEVAYWRPQVMRHLRPDGRVEYAFHEVYFSQDGSVVSYTADALSERTGSVEELEAWVSINLDGSRDGIVCGDLGYTYADEDLALWLKHITDPPLDYESDG